MDTSKLKDFSMKINANINAINESAIINDTDKSFFTSINNLVDLIIGLFDKSVNKYYVSNYLTNTNNLFSNINTTLESNVLPYINSDPHKQHIKSQISSLKQYITELQIISTNISFLGFPTKHKFINSATQKQLKDTDELLKSRYEKIEEMNKSIILLDDMFNQKSKEINSKISEMESKLTKYSNTQTEALNTRVENIKSSIELIKDEFLNEKKSLIESVTKELNDEVEKAENIVGLLSDNAQSNEYLKTANNYKKAKFYWQFASIIFLLITVGVGVFSIIPNSIMTIPINLIDLGIRIIIALSLGSAAAYAARLAHKNFKLEVRTRLVYLDLITIDSFLRNTDKPEVLKANMVNKIFGRFDELDKDENEDGIFLTVKQVKELTALINSIKK